MAVALLEEMDGESPIDDHFYREPALALLAEAWKMH